MQKLRVWMSTAMSVSLIATTLFFIILLYASSSIRPSYIHLLFNLLILAIGADSGILRVFLRSSSDTDTLVVIQTNVVDEVVSVCSTEIVIDDDNNNADDSIKVVCINENHESVKILGGGSVGTSDGEDVDDDDVEEIDEMELFARAEEFIEKFYKQLKMQREELCNIPQNISTENSQ